MIFGILELAFLALLPCSLSMQYVAKRETDLVDSDNCIVASQPLLKGSTISVSMVCNESHPVLRSNLVESTCFDNDLTCDSQLALFSLKFALLHGKKDHFDVQFNCTGHEKILLYTSDEGFFNLIIAVTEVNPRSSTKLYTIIKGPHGYLPADKWPLLNFYGFMCLVYGIYAVIWFVVSFMQWRDLQRIHLCIGAVILIGMIETAMFYLEYKSFNSTGESSLLGMEFVAELLSAAKRTLARILVIIVSLGYGIVNTRLGSHLPKIFIVGILYFTVASVEAYFRVVKATNIRANELLISGILLALLDSFICFWIFASLIQSIRTLRLQPNGMKLQLYSYFRNILVLAVIASTGFMLYTIKKTHNVDCFTGWKALWIDNAFWHGLFSAVLLAIMILYGFVEYLMCPGLHYQKYILTIS